MRYKQSFVLGHEVSEMLQHRLADMVAAASPVELIAGKPRVSNNSSEMIIDLRDGYSLLFGANHPKTPLTGDGLIDWAKVSRIKIMGIGRENV